MSELWKAFAWEDCRKLTELFALSALPRPPMLGDLEFKSTIHMLLSSLVESDILFENGVNIVTQLLVPLVTDETEVLKLMPCQVFSSIQKSSMA